MGVAQAYGLFLGAYFVGAALALSAKAGFPGSARERTTTENNTSQVWIKTFVVLKLGYLVYLMLLVSDYVLENGYAGIRGYLFDEELKNARFYSLLLAYVDSYIFAPLNMIFLVLAFLMARRWFWVLLAALLVQYFVVYAGRMVFYHVLILGLMLAIHQRQISWKHTSLVAVATGFLFFALALFLFIRDDTFGELSAESMTNALRGSVINYHLVTPHILDALTNSAEGFPLGNGWGLATFGFIWDPIVFASFDGLARDYMPSKTLSAAAQQIIVEYDGQAYNAFASFLYPALYDFSLMGPIIYGVFFGYLVAWSYQRKDMAGTFAYTMIGAFVYLNAFTFNIAGEWFFALVATGLLSRKLQRQAKPQDERVHNLADARAPQ